jgi:hypothetical protein
MDKFKNPFEGSEGDHIINLSTGADQEINNNIN